jgi:hypothetical protein
MANKKPSVSNKETTDDSTLPPQIPAVPPPDDPLRRAQEFEPDREFKSREMAEKRLAAIRRTREMPTSAEESSAPEPKPE